MPSPVPGTEKSKPAPMAGFRFLKTDSATIVPQKYITYRPPRVVKTKARWYVEYWYRVPAELRHMYNKVFYRFRVFEDINRYKTDEYAGLLKDAVLLALQDGLNPFQDELDSLAPETSSTEWSLNFGLKQFKEHCIEKGLRKKTIESYTSTINVLTEYFYRDNRIFQSLSLFIKQDFKDLMTHYKKLNGWEPKTYNGYLSNMGIIFNWFVKEDKLMKSPLTGIETKKVTPNRHKYYDKRTADKLKADILKADPYLYSFIEFIYYTATRPKSEARLLKIKHILFDRMLIHIPGHIAKNKVDAYIPMDESLAASLKHLENLNPELFIWGTTGPAILPAGQNHFANHFKPFKDRMGLSIDYTIYGFKHTRAIDLVTAGANPYDIMRLFRHSSLDMTMKYLRDLGLTDFSDILKKGKKFAG